MADFGTGKTSLLFEKATQLLEQRETVLVVIFEVGSSTRNGYSSTTSMNESLLTTQYRLKFGQLVQEKPQLKPGVYRVFGLTEKGEINLLFQDTSSKGNMAGILLYSIADPFLRYLK